MGLLARITQLKNNQSGDNCQLRPDGRGGVEAVSSPTPAEIERRIDQQEVTSAGPTPDKSIKARARFTSG